MQRARLTDRCRGPVIGNYGLASSPVLVLTTSASSAAVLRCTDEEPPPNGESCRDVKESGACYDGWIAASGFCHATCGRNCTEAIVEPDPETGVRDLSQLPCFDRQPWGPFSCFEHRHIYNNCGQNWMLQGGFCSFSCGFCSKGMI